jgi:cytochrome c551/c552
VKVLPLALALAFTSGAALGQGDAVRAKCSSCHDAERRKVGPSLREIAAKYKGDRSRAAPILAGMKEGRGHPKVAGSDAELQAAVDAAIGAK